MFIVQFMSMFIFGYFLFFFLGGGEGFLDAAIEKWDESAPAQRPW